MTYTRSKVSSAPPCAGWERDRSELSPEAGNSISWHASFSLSRAFSMVDIFSSLHVVPHLSDASRRHVLSLFLGNDSLYSTYCSGRRSLITLALSMLRSSTQDFEKKLERESSSLSLSFSLSLSLLSLLSTLYSLSYSHSLLDAE